MSKLTPAQSKQRQMTASLTVDGGVKMNAKKLSTEFKKLAVGLSVTSLVNVSGLP